MSSAVDRKVVTTLMQVLYASMQPHMSEASGSTRACLWYWIAIGTAAVSDVASDLLSLVAELKEEVEI